MYSVYKILITIKNNNHGRPTSRSQVQRPNRYTAKPPGVKWGEKWGRGSPLPSRLWESAGASWSAGGASAENIFGAF